MSYIAKQTTFGRAPKKTSALQKLLGVHELFRQRRQLNDLPDYLLRDIGLDRKDVQTEMKKQIWNAPAHFRKS